MITYISPYRTDKNIGRALNEAIEPINTEWVCVMDHDCMFLLPTAKARVEEVCKGVSKGDWLMGPVTNRLNPSLCAHQLHEGRLNNEMDIMKHYDIAKDLAEDKLLKKCNLIAGCCMIFRKSTWDKARFKENTTQFDQIFSKDVLKLGGTLAVICDLYLFHLYRAWSSSPVNDTKHLK